MVLRKHIQGGKIYEITQSGFDRVINIKIDTYNEMGDSVEKTLIIEIMGRHSNIILVGPTGIIYDAVKHIDSSMSSLREVLPAHPYLPPPEQNKIMPDDSVSIAGFISQDLPSDFEGSISSYILNNFSGFSPLLCKSICNRAGVSPTILARNLSENDKNAVFSELVSVCKNIADHNYKPAVIIGDTAVSHYEPTDFHCIATVFNDFKVRYFSTVNLMLDEFFTQKDVIERSRQKKSAIKKHLSNAITRTEKKLRIHDTAIRESEDYDIYRIKGELITANMYLLKGGESTLEAVNYYSETGEILTISLDKNKDSC